MMDGNDDKAPEATVIRRTTRWPPRWRNWHPSQEKRSDSQAGTVGVGHILRGPAEIEYTRRYVSVSLDNIDTFLDFSQSEKDLMRQHFEPGKTYTVERTDKVSNS